MKITCANLKYSPSRIKEISKIYSDQIDIRRSTFTLAINNDSTFETTYYGDLGPPPFNTIYKGTCELKQDTLRLTPIFMGNEEKISKISDTLKLRIIQYYHKHNYYLIRKLNDIIYLIEPDEVDKFCAAVIEHKSKNDYFYIERK
ncbi:MAG TPA: hypothetical protein VFE71_01950 [Bacteroidales bacterium]|nr:hypothetical protein [Bacteroidales bacterium]